MREIKFRAWDKTQNRMVPDKELQMHSLPDFRAVPLNESLIMLGLVYHLMQFTGLKDKNGKEIYEGDICIVWGHPQLHQDFEYKSLVVWSEFSYGFNFQKIEPPEVMWDIGHNTCEVTGNIYENPLPPS